MLEFDAMPGTGKLLLSVTRVPPLPNKDNLSSLKMPTAIQLAVEWGSRAVPPAEYPA